MIKKTLVKKSKYGNKKVVIDGITFDSIAEGDRYSELRILEKIGEIKNLLCHQKIRLESGITFKPDFIYIQNNLLIAEDYKGCITTDYKLRRKLFIHEYIKSGLYDKYLESYRDGTIKEIKPPKAKKQ